MTPDSHLAELIVDELESLWRDFEQAVRFAACARRPDGPLRSAWSWRMIEVAYRIRRLEAAVGPLHEDRIVATLTTDGWVAAVRTRDEIDDY